MGSGHQAGAMEASVSAGQTEVLEALGERSRTEIAVRLSVSDRTGTLEILAQRTHATRGGT